MSIAQMFFSFFGRLDRRKYWIVLAANLAVLLVIIALFNGLLGGPSNVFRNFLLALITLPLISIWTATIQRLHDRNLSSWWLLVFLLPGVFMVWGLVELLLRRGTTGPNEFGDDPLEMQVRWRPFGEVIALYRALSLVALIVVWWIASTTSPLTPSPWATFQSATVLVKDPTLWRAVRDSLFVYVGGFAIAVAIGIPIGLMLGGFRVVGRTFEVYINALMATPRIAFIPLIIVYLGLGYEAKIFIIFLGAVMPVIVNTYAGVLNADGELVEMARSAGARRSQIFLRILLPGALPFIVVGLRLGATIGLINTVVAELYTAITGLGGLLRIYGGGFRMAPYFVVVLILSLVGVLVTQALRGLELRMERWRYQAR